MNNLTLLLPSEVQISMHSCKSSSRPLRSTRDCHPQFDKAYGGGCQCIVGTDFGSFVTHCYGCFIYFCIGSLAILLFRGSAAPEAEASQFASLEIVKA
ncbi:Dynein light chain 2, cytoplasmic [Camellia lanceoleosa]|uniref:Dynein light chain 2, cytoplasmic n=1 Tax=Camellia lanceoleosa TaxID=1840588 RepID=A0ACC0H9S6_9ERIC|nr:Dynein light chain 2, cytoplasmic [Camellia lanceoleosa]